LCFEINGLGASSQAKSLAGHRTVWLNLYFIASPMVQPEMNYATDGAAVFYMRLIAIRASALDFSIRAGSWRIPPTLMRRKVLPFKT